MQEQPGRGQERTAAPESPAPPSSVLDELRRLGQAARRLYGAQLHLLAAELGLARSAVSWLFVAALVATVAGVALGLTLLGLVGLLLATWFHSWVWALVVLALLQVVLLAGAIVLFRRCMHWMSLPATRHEWGAMMHDARQRAAREENGEGTARGEGEP